MADQDRAAESGREGAESTHHKAPGPLPTTPSDKAERPEGLAFDVEPGADLTGVPIGDQRPKNPGAARTQETVREAGDGVGLAVPSDQATPDDDQPSSPSQRGPARSAGG
jgi:hypothetical protein